MRDLLLPNLSLLGNISGGPAWSVPISITDLVPYFGGGGVTAVTGTPPISSSGGTTPDISLDNSGVTPATYGDSFNVAQFTVDAHGLLTFAGNVPIAASGGTLWLYKAKTTATSGYPADGYMLWNNATQISATDLIFAHITTDNIDLDALWALVPSGSTLLLQDSNDSANFQKWTISGAPINTNGGTATSYWTVPVTLVSSGGTGTTNFANNHQLVVFRVGAVATGTDQFIQIAFESWG